ncbi:MULTISPECIES: 6-pyruvoyl trahydropterin synthase family protein [unclassified Helicobacter]|uniref:6-pyruvoyl trahydropterin synthase family protein n=1 Tax=unclassified Helicobacter TaxID=2593540 RepID=UPI000CF12FCB|nr:MULTISPECIES: 6-pyruvoyl tetrahydropterin synthase family protein [unclassified Helicobacter]
MIIRRMFKFCAAHIVRNCYSQRCSRSLHGHNYQVEIFVKSDKLDNAGMVLDFGIFKNQIADFIDSFDHSYHFWDKEKKDFQDFILKHSERYVILKFNPSAESYALLFLFFIDKFIGAMDLGNSEGRIVVDSVRVHETDHGYAQAFQEDLQNPHLTQNLSLDSITFSQAILEEWRDKQMLEKLRQFNEGRIPKPFNYPMPIQQI